MDPFNMTRTELRKMKKRDLLKLTWEQKKRWCNVRSRVCGHFIRYKGLGFCLTELLGKGCSPDLALGEEAENRGGQPEEVIQCLWQDEGKD